MTSKSASAAFADGSAFSSRSRAVSAALPAAEKPRMRYAAGGGCADGQLAAIRQTTAARKDEGRGPRSMTAVYLR
jgi:hypothetical protein